MAATIDSRHKHSCEDYETGTGLWITASHMIAHNCTRFLLFKPWAEVQERAKLEKLVLVFYEV